MIDVVTLHQIEKTAESSLYLGGRPESLRVACQSFVRLVWMVTELLCDMAEGEFTYAQRSWDAYVSEREWFDEILEESMLEPKTTEREIEVALSDAEREDRRKQFEIGWEHEQRIKADKLVANQGYNADLKEVRALQKACHDAFTSGKEKKKIEVYERRDERRGAIEILDAKTHAKLDERPMTGPEREMKLFSEDGQQALVKANGKGRAHKNGSATALAKDPLKASVSEVAAGKPKQKAKRGKAKERVVELVGEGVADGRRDGELVDEDYDPVGQLDGDPGPSLDAEFAEVERAAGVTKPKRAKRSKPAAKAAKPKRARKAAAAQPEATA